MSEQAVDAAEAQHMPGGPFSKTSQEASARRESMAPVLYLDIDGVICLEPRVDSDDEIFSNIGEPVEMDGIEYFIDPDCVGRIKALQEDFDVVWATAWFDRAKELGQFLGLDEFEVLDWRAREYKIEEIAEHHAGRLFVWIDDDADWELRSVRGPATQFLALNPGSRIGLQDEHVQQARGWLAMTV